MTLLAHARQKVQGVLETISQVRELDFPFIHATHALAQVESHFLSLRRTLASLSDKNDARTVETFCKSALESIFRFLPIIGFISRSTEVTGPVEFHGPFLRLVRRAIGPEAKLIISSDWDFSPYTYIFPELFHDHHMVMVGLPVSESDNALVTPTAGHELGHNIWEKEQLREHFEDILAEAILGLIAGKHWPKFSSEYNITKPEQLRDDLFARSAWENALIWSTAQCEELFCDLVGLLCFRESYLHAFEYLLSPWGFVRTERYPSIKDRIAVMVRAAKKNAIVVPDKFETNFGAPTETSPLLLTISDEASQMTVDNLMEIAETLVKENKLLPEKDERAQIAESLRNCVPATRVTYFQNIISAGWQLRKSLDDLWLDDYPTLADQPDRKLRVLNELLLKSLEVDELEQLQLDA